MWRSSCCSGSRICLSRFYKPVTASRSVETESHSQNDDSQQASTSRVDQYTEDTQRFNALDILNDFNSRPSDVDVENQKLWRMNEKNRFKVVPQTWIVDFEGIKQYKQKITSLHPDVFHVNPRLDLLHRNLHWQQQYRSVSFVKALTRGELPYGGRKPWTQLKSGRGHAGSIREPHFTMGGIAHGMRGPLTWFYMLPDSVRLEGLCVALTIKHIQDDLVVVRDFDQLQSASSYTLHKMAEARNWGYSLLFVDSTDVAPKNLALACEKVPYFNILPVYGVNCHSVVKHDTLVLTEAALVQLQQRILRHKQRARPLAHKFKYKDWKHTLLNETEHPHDDEHPHQTPFV